ncbi:MAG: delta-60 repeat domain-containing protein [Bacteroidota bacterium]
MKLKNALLNGLTFILLIAGAPLLAQEDGTIDQTFNPYDVGANTGTNDNIEALDVQSDGKLLIGGAFTKYGNQVIGRIARINPDESLDETFDTGTGANGTVTFVKCLPDGKILICGYFTSFNGVNCGTIARLNQNGSLDTTFNIGAGIGAGTDDFIRYVKVNSQGEIFIGGNFTVFHGVQKSYIVKLSIDGVIDDSFNAASEAQYFYDIAFKPDGSILGASGGYIFNLQANGVFVDYSPVVDASFQILKLYILENGKIFVFLDSGSPSIIRLNADYTVDPTFTLDSAFANKTVFDCLLSVDNELYAIFLKNTTSRKIVKFTSTGSVDTSFAISDNDVDCWINTLLYVNNGKLYAAGIFTSINGIAENNLVRFNTDGSRDNAFDIGANTLTGADAAINIIRPQADGKIIIHGPFHSYNGVERRGLARINADGTIDETFNPGSGINLQSNSFMKFTPEGKIILAAFDLDVYNGTPVNKIVRINQDGTLDTAFAALPFTFTTEYYDFYFNIVDISVQPDGKVLISGPLATYGGIPVNSFIRLNTDGSLDTTFDTTNINENVISIRVLPAEQKMLLEETSNVSVPHYFRKFNFDGSLDTGFSTIVAQGVSRISIEPDGKILLARRVTQGGPWTFNNILYIDRYNHDGTFNSQIFSAAANSGSGIWAIHSQQDGKILLVGEETVAPYTTAIVLKRLNADGTVDAGFSNGFADGSIQGLVFQEDKIICIGSFEKYNNLAKNRIIRLNNSGIPLGVDVNELTSDNFFVYRNNDALQVFSSNNVISSVQVYDLAGRIVAEENKVGADEVSIFCPARGNVFIVKVTMADGVVRTQKLY